MHLLSRQIWLTVILLAIGSVHTYILAESKPKDGGPVSDPGQWEETTVRVATPRGIVTASALRGVVTYYRIRKHFYSTPAMCWKDPASSRNWMGLPHDFFFECKLGTFGVDAECLEETMPGNSFMSGGRTRQDFGLQLYSSWETNHDKSLKIAAEDLERIIRPLRNFKIHTANRLWLADVLGEAYFRSPTAPKAPSPHLTDIAVQGDDVILSLENAEHVPASVTLDSATFYPVRGKIAGKTVFPPSRPRADFQLTFAPKLQAPTMEDLGDAFRDQLVSQEIHGSFPDLAQDTIQSIQVTYYDPSQFADKTKVDAFVRQIASVSLGSAYTFCIWAEGFALGPPSLAAEITYKDPHLKAGCFVLWHSGSRYVYRDGHGACWFSPWSIPPTRPPEETAPK